MDPITVLDIVNRALLSLGSNPASSLADTAKPAARAVAAYYNCRNEVLRLVDWPSCTKRTELKNVAEMATPWTASTYYYVGDRVTNDSDKTYTCTEAGTSDTAGGPTGTGSGITDNTATWEYTEASTALNNWCHQPSTAYVVDDIVAWDANKVYRCITAGTTAADTPPTGTDAEIDDGTVQWAYYGTIPHNHTVYTYQYVMPPDCLKIRKVPLIGAPYETTQGVQFLREHNWIYTDQDDSVLLYTRREEDPDQWDPLCRDVVAYKIASEIALDVTGKRDIAQTALGRLAMAFQLAYPVAMSEAREAEPEVTRWESVL